MKSKRQKWAIKRNWLILRLKGASSIFSLDSCKFMESLLPKSERHLVNEVDLFLDDLIKLVSKSKYKE